MANRYPPLGAMFENFVQQHTKDSFKPSEKQQISILTHKNPLKHNDSDDERPEGAISKSLWWANPPTDNLAVEFCEDTSIHGLKFVTQKKRHLSERIFWIIAFLLGVAAAVMLINDVWRRYKENPVIVSFQPKEQDIDTIPFPAVTFCNINKFPKAAVRKLKQTALSAPNPKDRTLALKQLIYVRSVCNAQQSFAKQFDYAHTRGEDEHISYNDTIDEDEQDDLVEFIRDMTIPCEELLRLCLFGEEPIPCGEIFKPIVTDFGKCCTFNMLPIPLLHIDPSPDEPTAEKTKKEIWSKDEIALWKLWKYNEGLIITDQKTTRPYRQKRAGMPYGLSILADPNIEQYYCPAADSEGFRFMLHTPLEMPHIMEFSSVLEISKELFVEVHPDVTNADDDIRSFAHAERQCYFGTEKQLKFFQPYTGSNCIDECSALVITKRCNCSFFYMPRYDGVKVCNNDEDSADNKCIEKARVNLLDTLKDECGHCDSLCEDISYNIETTLARLQNGSSLWEDHENKSQPGYSPPAWANHKMSIVHIYIGSETTVPKLRKTMYGTVDLIASTGGLLGLCLGVSVLSAIEAIYFLTLRAYWKFSRRKSLGKSTAKKFIDILKGRMTKKRVVNLDPNHIQFYPQFYPQKPYSWYKNLELPNQHRLGKKAYVD